MIQSVQTTIPPYQHLGQRDWVVAEGNSELYTDLPVNAIHIFPISERFDIVVRYFSNFES